MTRIIRSDAPFRPVSVGIVVWALALAVLFFAALFAFVGLTVPTAFTGNEQTVLAVWLGMIFLILAVMLDLYRKYYVPDEMIHKKRRPKIVLRREKKGRGGKTATVIEGIRLPPSGLERIARELKRALGCGARIEGTTIVVQGDLTARIEPWLADHGAKRIVIGN